MEMYADEEARGGVLEPEGIVGLKFRKEKQLETMARLDGPYGELKRRMADPNLTREQLAEVKTQMTQREQLLLPLYSQIALQFADLHDRAGRMEAKGTIRRALRWQNARRFFYWRLRRRLNEEHVLRRLRAAQEPAHASRSEHLQMLASWSQVPGYDEDDMSVATWLEENKKEITDRVDAATSEAVAFGVAELLHKDKDAGLKGVAQMLNMLPAQEREEALRYLSKA